MKFQMNALLLAALMGLAPLAAGATTLNVPAGTQLNATIDSTLDSKTANVGDLFTAHVVAPFPDGYEALQGAVLTGEVTKVKRAGQGTKPEIDLKFDQLRLADGSSAPVTGYLTQAQTKTAQKSGARTAIATVGGLLAGNLIAKTVFGAHDHGVAGAAGAVGGFLIGNNYKADVQFPAGSAMTVQMQQTVQVRPQAR